MSLLEEVVLIKKLDYDKASREMLSLKSNLIAHGSKRLIKKWKQFFVIASSPQNNQEQVADLLEEMIILLRNSMGYNDKFKKHELLEIIIKY